MNNTILNTTINYSDFGNLIIQLAKNFSTDLRIVEKSNTKSIYEIQFGNWWKGVYGFTFTAFNESDVTLIQIEAYSIKHVGGDNRMELALNHKNVALKKMREIEDYLKSHDK